MKKLLLVLTLVSFLVPAAVQAGGLSILVGAQSVSFGGDLGKYYDIPAGTAPALIVGLDMGLPIDLRIGQRTATEGNSGGDLTYRWIEVGSRIVMARDDAQIKPELFFGGGSYDLEIGSTSFDTAAGAYVGLGVEETLADKYLGRLEVKGVYFKSDTFNTDAPSLNVSLLFGFKL